MMIIQDESIFKINKGQGLIWGTGDQPFIQPKTKGAGIMVRYFITQQDGYLALSSEECKLAAHASRTSRVFLEYGCDKEGYWTGETFIANVRDATAITNFKYPSESIPYCGYLIRAAAIVPMEKML